MTKTVALYDVDSKIPNLALMKLARFHNERGDRVRTFEPLWMPTYDRIYASKVFDYSVACHWQHRRAAC